MFFHYEYLISEYVFSSKQRADSFYIAYVRFTAVKDVFS